MVTMQGIDRLAKWEIVPLDVDSLMDTKLMAKGKLPIPDRFDRARPRFFDQDDEAERRVSEITEETVYSFDAEGEVQEE